MGKTYKDRANHARFHDYEPTGDKEKDLYDILESHPNQGLRHGNNRKMYAQAKRIERRQRRRKLEHYDHD